MGEDDACPFWYRWKAFGISGLVTAPVAWHRKATFMGRVITFTVGGHEFDKDTTAPTADDLLDQIRDYLEIFRGVERALAEDGQNAIEWRVINASRQNPILMQLEAYPKQYAVDIAQRVNAVARNTAAGLAELVSAPTRPRFFSDATLERVERTFERVTNGLDLSGIDFGSDDIPAHRITKASAHGAARNAKLAQTPEDRPYRELGAIEGMFRSVERDGHGHKLLWIKHRLTGDEVKCQLEGDALNLVGDYKIGEVFRGRRVLVTGTIHYKGLGAIRHVDATDVRFFPPATELPNVDTILDENFTGGLTTEEYLARLRDGNLS
jgi:hypothetical protein